MRHIYYFTSYVILLCSFCLSCDNDDKTVGQEEFNTFVNGKYFDSIDAGIWLRQTEVGLQEINDQLDGTGPVITGMFWFTDGNTFLTPAVIDESAIMETSLDFKWRQYLHERGEEITLFVRSNYRYDPLTGRLSTDNQSLVREKGGSSYYIEGISGKGFTLRIEFKEPLHYDMGGFRNTYKENLSPDLRPDSPYKVFDSNEEAIAYVKKLLGE